MDLLCKAHTLSGTQFVKYLLDRLMWESEHVSKVVKYYLVK